MRKTQSLLIAALFIAACLFAAGGLALDVTPQQEYIGTHEPAETPLIPVVTFTAAPAVSTAASAASTISPPEPEPLYREIDVVMLAKVIWAEARGVPSDAEKAAVAWCTLNRLDAGKWGDTLEEVLTAPHQFAYRESSPVTTELAELSRDVLERWQAERRGATDVGRTLPADYFFFDGDGERNHFRQQYERTGETWDWSLPNPYTS